MAATIVVRKPAELKRAYQRIAKGIQKPFKSTRRMFVQLGVQIDRDTILTFKREGAHDGRMPWKPFSLNTLRTKLGTPKLRYGTDKKPKRTAKELAKYKTEHGYWYRPGKMPGYTGDRRYGTKSKLLQASGGFRDSFKIIRIGKDRMKYGTTYGGKLAENIMKNPARPALQYTRQDELKYMKTIIGWWKQSIKI